MQKFLVGAIFPETRFRQKIKSLKTLIFKEIDSLSQKYNPYVKYAYMYTIQYVVNFAYILIGAIFPETILRQKIKILILLYISQNRILYSQG